MGCVIGLSTSIEKHEHSLDEEYMYMQNASASLNNTSDGSEPKFIDSPMQSKNILYLIFR
jgi:hypothetical protein